MSELSISPAEQAKLKKALADFGSKKSKKLQRVTELAVRNIVAEAQRKVPVYQGRLRASLRPIMSQNKLSGRAFTNVEYAAAIEFGTKLYKDIPPEIASDVAGLAVKSDGNFEDLIEALKKWCKKKGIPEAAAFPIAIKLLNIGQKPQPFLYPAFKAEKRKYIEAIKQIMAQNETT